MNKIGKWFCSRHPGVLLVRTNRSGVVRSPLLIRGFRYCPVCWNEQVQTIKQRGLERAQNNFRRQGDKTSGALDSSLV